MYPESCTYIGVEYMITPILVAYFDNVKYPNLTCRALNTDGLPITKNSKSTLWPILIYFVNIPNGRFNTHLFSKRYIKAICNSIVNILFFIIMSL